MSTPTSFRLHHLRQAVNSCFDELQLQFMRMRDNPNVPVSISWKKYKVGMLVLCGFCCQEHAIEAIKAYGGATGFELACGHRNAYCEQCEVPVKDTSILPNRLSPDCPVCRAIGRS